MRFVPAVMMSGSGTGNASTATDSSGKYQLSNLIEGGNYTVTASKTGAVNSSITAFDATLVLRCVAAGDNCDLSNDQKMVADSDNSGTITSFDATQILRFVAANGQNADTDQTGNWKFSPAQLSYQNLNTSQADQNFVAFLIGDVDGDWAP